MIHYISGQKNIDDGISSEKAKAVFDLEEKSKLEKAHGTIQHPDQFAEVFCNAAETQNKVKEVIKKEVKVVVSSDSEMKTFFKNIIKEVEKEEMWIWGKKIGFAVWTILILVAGALISKYIK
jgi:hypothetical protein